MTATALSGLHLDRLIHFHAVARHASLRRAAESLHLTPPALTRSLQKLEAEVGTRLCLRGRGGVRLTDEGERLLRTTERVVAELERYLHSPEPPEAYAGIVGLGFLDQLSVPRLDRALDAMLRRFPACRLNLVSASSDELARLVEAEELDLAFSVFDRRLAGLRYRAIQRDPFRYYISARHPLWGQRAIGRRDLEGRAVAWIDHERLDRAVLEAAVFRPAPAQTMRVRAFSNHVDGGLRLLLGGHAVVPMPRAFMRPWLERGEVRQLSVRPRVAELVTYCADKPGKTDRTDPAPAPPVAFLLGRLGFGAQPS